MKTKTVTRFLLALPLLAMFSCKPTLKVASDYDHSADFSKYKTFGMYYLVTSANINQLNEERIWNSIRTEMLRKGYREDNHNPDLVVNAVSVLDNKKYLAVNSSAIGAGYLPAGYFGGGAVVRNGSVQAYDYKNGSLKIDVVDVKADKLVWVGTGSADITKQPKNPEEAISKTVNRILASFPAGNTRM